MTIPELQGTEPVKPSLKDRPIDWAKQNPVPAGIAALVVLGIFGGGGDNYQDGAYQRQAIQSFNDSARFDLKKNEQAERYRQKAFEIALERQSRCISLTTDGANTHATVVQGLRVTDPVTGHPLPAGTAVCDQYGWTALLDETGAMTQLLQGQVSPNIQLRIEQPVQPTPAPTPPQIYVPAITN